MNENYQNIGQGGEILEPSAGSSAFPLQSQPQGMGVHAIDHGQAAAQAQATALVNARFQMALMRPRNVFQARSRILDACRRPGFAESAIFRKPVGKKDNVQQFVEGPSIRFAEEAIRDLGNIDVRQQVVYEDDEKRVVCVTVMDLENNVAWPTEVAVSKRIERSYVKEGQKVHGTRKNSYGKNVYIVDASEDEIITKQQAMVSKALRTAALRIVPGDILEEALAQVRETLTKKDTQDPKGALKRVLDAFNGLGIQPSELERFLDHSLETITPSEIQDLRGTYQSLKDGDSNWKDVLAAAEADKVEKQKAKDKPADLPQDPPKDAAAVVESEKKLTPAEEAKKRARGASGTLPLDE
jgi:hypothetical protein